MNPPIDDHSSDLATIRALAVDRQGVTLAEFSKSLTPRFGEVYRDILVGYLAILITVASAMAAQTFGAPLWIVGPIVALSVGYWVAYLMLFIHEGAHWNLAADRDYSDRLANLLIGWWAGIDIARYRRVHFEHHRSLGTIKDSEFSYFFALNLAFVAKILLGIATVEVIVSRARADAMAEPAHGKPTLSARLYRKRQALIGAAIHGLIVGGLGISGFWVIGLGWCVGIALVFPFFGALRPLLEHRSTEADPAVDYSVTDHGGTTRLFGDDWLSRSFSGAGFNRHLLHHWQPGVSYTRLPNMERFLLTTDLRPIIEARRTTHLGAVRALVRSNSVAKAPPRLDGQPAL